MYADMKQTLERLDAAPPNGSVGGSKKRDEDRDPLLHANAPGPAHGNGGPTRPLTGWRLQARRAAFTALDLCVAGVDIFIVILGPILALLASSLFSFIIYVYFTEVLPGLLVSRGTVMAQVITLFGLWIVFNLFFNYLRAMFVGPGSSPAELDGATQAALADDPELTTPGAQHRFCSKCQRIKPMRAHHCSICKKCVLRFDHHCPWINNCVGHKNLRHFFLFLFYLWSGSAFFLITSAGDAVHALLGVMDSASFLIAVVLSFSAFIATSCFLAWNVYLIVTNQSTVEFSGAIFKRKGMPNPFDHGFSANWRSVFGDDGVWTFWLPTLKPPPGNGYVFPLQRRGVSHVI